jgi:catechol 2,3-dioxygenase-like lactoylglutathione lyase family enzyme
VLGHFLEFSIATRPLAPSAAYFTALGFRAAETADTLAHPYAAYFDDSVTFGLHERDAVSPALTFVRPDLRNYVRALRRLRIELDDVQLADDEFNRVAFRDPTGQTVVLLEARTFTPGTWEPHDVCVAGTFLEYSVPTEDLAAARAFWEDLGLKPLAEGDTPHAFVRLGGHGLVLGLHAMHFQPGFAFFAPRLDARVQFLKAKGCAPRHGAPALAASDKRASLTTPDGTTLYLFETG